MFTFLGVPPVLGRGITPADASPTAPPVFVMADKMWLKTFNRDPGILGRTFVLNGVTTTLVGIMPPRFTKLAADLWRPVRLDRGNAQMSRQYFMFQARLKPGVTFQQAAADMDVIAHRLAATYPDNYPKQFTVNAVSWVDSIVGQFKTTLYTLAAAVGLLLLIACSNVANMLLARATAREKEMAVRVSLGATRWRLVRQLLIESLLLAAGGAIVGCLFAYGGVKAVTLLIPDGFIPREAVIRLNAPVLIFSLTAAMLTTMLFGLIPALQTARRDMVEPLKDAGKGVSGGFRRGRLRSALVVVEVALSLLLLVGAGLLIRSFVSLRTVDLGFNPENILVTAHDAARGQYTTAPEAALLPDRARPRSGAARRRRRDRNNDAAAVWRHRYRPRDHRQDAHRKVERDLPVVQRRLLPDSGSPAFPRPHVLRRGGQRRERSSHSRLERSTGCRVRAAPGGRACSYAERKPSPRARCGSVFDIIGVTSDAKNQGIEEPW
jgi:predicted permease